MMTEYIRKRIIVSHNNGLLFSMTRRKYFRSTLARMSEHMFVTHNGGEAAIYNKGSILIL